MQLGFIGFGEAAFELSIGLKQQGFGEIVAYDPMWNHPAYGSLVQERAEKAQVSLLKEPEAVLSRVNILIVAVPADKAYDVSHTLKPHLEESCIYVDVSASNPEVKRSIHDNLKGKGVTFVDAAMMGPLPVYKHKVPILASGDGTDAFIDLLSPYGMDISKVSDTPGDASAVKLIRSIYMKGIAALLVEMLEAANHFNVDELVISSLSETMNGKSFEETMNRLVTGTSIHAVRRAVELEGSIDMLESSSIDSTMSQAAKEKLQRLSKFNLKEKFQGKTPSHWSDVINALQH
ncbi:prephenate dehydrogenase/arogenate dehydrogenase family protein [Paenibacillus sp. LMG 31456]|uniref:Prephenate dehydrogenase/arogenate dehydrogenase family protein n=1 Tax=Paenibacillus foliorum TaxID=2654974 RepID=A0A972JXL7_9BACL|nr:prephenate dehydrogenase/arogenate dehydrogenase family protein [Paenibacillus foliorum]NOU92589.1 prephenate dehydrogenase/arogenate dehydrogenase family protein [Paenibacillus foliorum]